MAFSVPRLGGDGSFEFTIQGSPGQALGIETSGDLSNWLLLAKVPLTNTIQVFHDSAPDPWHRYYRAVTLPQPTVTSP